jgi:hypothetical protein
VLRDRKIPRVVWFEDTLHYYGIPTVVFDLYILVPDIDTAADCLVKAGWLVDTQGRPTIGNAYVDLPQRRLVCPDGHTKSVLLPAVDWNQKIIVLIPEALKLAKPLWIKPSNLLPASTSYCN